MQGYVYIVTSLDARILAWIAVLFPSVSLGCLMMSIFTGSLTEKKQSSTSAVKDKHVNNVNLIAGKMVSRTLESCNSKGPHQWTLTQVLNSYRPWLRGFLLGWHPLTSSMCSRKTSLILHTSNISACLSSVPPPARREKPVSDLGEAPRLLRGGLGNPWERLLCHSSQDEAADLGAGHSWWLFLGGGQVLSVCRTCICILKKSTYVRRNKAAQPSSRCNMMVCKRKNTGLIFTLQQSCVLFHWC